MGKENINHAGRLLLLWRCQVGITGIETAIVLIAFVVVAAVFAFTVLSTGVLATGKSKETILGGLEATSATMAFRGSVIAHKLTGLEVVESVVFQVINASQTDGEINLARSGTNSTLITYIDDGQTKNLTENEWLATWLIGSGNLLGRGERVEIRVTLTGVFPLLGTSTEFTLEVKPTVGSLLILNKKTPGEMTPVMDLK